MKLIFKSIFILSLSITIFSCTENITENQQKGNQASATVNENTQKPAEKTESKTTVKQASAADLERKSKVEVPIFKNELANKLVNRLQAIQVAKLERGNIPDLQKQEEAVIMELSSISNLLIGEEKMIMSQYLAEMDIHDGHIH